MIIFYIFYYYIKVFKLQTNLRKQWIKSYQVRVLMNKVSM